MYNSCMKKLFKNNSGFSLVQTIVAMGLAGGLAVFLMRLTENMRKTQKYTEVKSNELQIFSRVGSYLSIKQMCSPALVSKKPGENFDTLQFNDSGTGTKLEVGKEIENSGLIVDEMKILEEVTPMDTSTGLYEITVRVTLKRKGSNSIMGGTTKNKDFILVAQLCDDFPTTYPDSIKFTSLTNQCTNAANRSDVEVTWQEPKEDDDAPDSGPFTCYHCGPTKQVLECMP